jgi:peptidoglycan/xylan/chitin deacetylase (PgdA/CDA1 family)
MRGLRSLLTRGLTVFVYHDVTERPSEFLKISGDFTRPDFFEQQLDWIRERFTPIAPVDLPQLGGTRKLPANAALITFDDAWAGVFRNALPILASRGIPSLCFVNMATIQGTPDLAAVRRYERITLTTKRSRLDDNLDNGKAAQVLSTIEEQYGEDTDFRRFQGDTATVDDVLDAPGDFWLASHLFHHWDVESVSSDVFIASARQNWEALTSFPNALHAIATPWGRRSEWVVDRARELEIRTVFVASGGQNRDPEAFVLDRLQVEPEPSGPEDWWWATHRRRLFGGLAS